MAASSAAPEQPQATSRPEPHYTVFIRLPFPRGDFVDPPPVVWNSKKDRALWEVISEASSGREIDWHTLAEKFDVTLNFLLQQAAWLYERQLSQVRAQLRKVNRPLSVGTPPMPSSVSGSGVAMTRGGSGGSRVPSSLSHRTREQAASRGEAESPEAAGHLRGPRMSRTSSTNTVFQVQKSSPVAPVTSQDEAQSSFQRRQKGQEARRSSISASPKLAQKALSRPTTPPSKIEESNSSSSLESANEAPLSRSKAYTRRPRYSSAKAPLGPLSDADEDSGDSPPFLPFSDVKGTKKTVSPTGDPSATLRASPKPQTSQRPALNLSNKPQHLNASRTVHSSSSSAQSQPVSRESQGSRVPLSSLSPRQRRLAKEGSDGAPSMGSSFSDLDDASVTQSALEEALANEMRHGGVASRMSTISQALRSRYL